MRWWSNQRRAVTRRLAAATAVGVVVSASCAAPPPEIGGTVQERPVRSVVTRDVDHPPRLDCEAWRYPAPDPAAQPADYDGTNYRDDSTRDATVARSQQRLCGQRGAANDLAWGVTHGRDDVMTAVLDSGISWADPGQGRDLAERAHVNAGEVPKPTGSTSHDANGDGIVSASDWAGDRRVGDRNRSGWTDPQDLIESFSDGIDDDGNGYIDDISGWDFLFGDNDPYDNVDYGHGTGMAADAVASDGGSGAVGVCFECRVLHVRVGDSFIADGARFAAGVLFAVDSGAAVVQESLGVISNPVQAQQAIDAAAERGVPIAASMADEASKHPNLPAALDRTIPVNSITTGLGPLTDLAGEVGIGGDYLALNGCTNYGGIAWISVPSNSCSSEATGRLGGMLALIVAAARDAGVARHPGIVGDAPGPLSANEVKQLLRATADDVDFSSPGTPGVDRANDEGGAPLIRYTTRAGWDSTFGFGRANTYEAVRAAAAGEIPPEADIASPALYEVLPASGTVEVVGHVAAVRSSSYSYAVQWAPGIDSPRWPAGDTWTTIASARDQRSPRTGALATLDLATVAAALPGGGTGVPAVDGVGDEDRFSVRLRIVVTDAEGRSGVALKKVSVHDDPTQRTQRRIESAGTSSPAPIDLDGDGRDELVLGTDDGTVHALRDDGSEAPGWPVRTEAASWWPTWSVTARAAGIAPHHELVGVGTLATADLDGDGSPEIAVGDGGGAVSIWSASGTLIARMHTDPAFHDQGATNRWNRLKSGVLAQPSLGDLDGDGRLEIVATAMDRHVYAWHGDGTPVDGFPVLVVDPARTAAVDPRTEAVRFADPDGVGDGGELIVTPTLADLDGDGRDEIVVGAQEQYSDETVGVFLPVGLPGLSANTRLYAIWGDGTAHPRSGADPFPAHPADQAYLPGWPQKLPMLLEGLLPTIGNGVNTQAVVGNFDGDPAPEIAAASCAGPLMVFDVDGHSPWGRELGLQIAPDWLGENAGARANSTDGGIRVAAFGGPAAGDLNGDGRLDLAMPTVGLLGALDKLLPHWQPGHTQMMAWDLRTRAPLAGMPRRTKDLAFFVTPALVDVDGDGDLDTVAGHGVSLLESSDAHGDVAAGWPKLTGGWVVGTPSFGDGDGDGRAEVTVVRRDGWLQAWRTEAPTSELAAGWARGGHDGTNAGAVP